MRLVLVYGYREMEEWAQKERVGEFIPHSFNPSEARRILIDTVDGMLDDLRAAWTRVSTAYAQALDVIS